MSGRTPEADRQLLYDTQSSLKDMFRAYDRRQRTFRRDHSTMVDSNASDYCVYGKGQESQVRSYLKQKTSELALSSSLSPRMPVIVTDPQVMSMEYSRKKQVSTLMVQEMRALLSPRDSLATESRKAQVEGFAESYLSPEEREKCDDVIADLDMTKYLPQEEIDAAKKRSKRRGTLGRYQVMSTQSQKLDVSRSAGSFPTMKGEETVRWDYTAEYEQGLGEDGVRTVR
ncbi:hypothetical protein J8273_2052 [Carpediemonas membranifera]|uniref:Uncharacterized protein n=1 Tax=Carpediemonas membranifera TaxID=201153 RepID=A0A8J6C086_9EUKA|nr:hypothetical protein J8273_2052 [Carpediemonas membranifera]|eukprot:KAG9396321.1 hypothetical protein J8273_2052 [Carpediemonas membranifera]